MTLQRLMSLVLVGFLSTVATACGGGDSDPTNPGGGNPTPSISINLSGTSLNITAGTAGQVTVSVTRSGGFTGAVTVSADVPAGVTAMPVTIASGSTSEVLTFQVAGSTAAGTLAATVRASGQGIQQVSAPLSLVIAAAPQQNFAVALGQASAVLTQGGSVTVPVQITRTNFTGAVTLTTTGLPQGVSGTFDPAAPTGTTSTLTLSATAGAVTGAATVTVQGAGTGVGNRTAALALTVQAPAPTGDYSLSLNPTSVQFQQGGQATTSVSINRTGGFTGAVALSATGLPQGVTASFNPASTTGNSSTLTLTATAGASTGAATVTVQGTATGIANRTATLNATVAQSGGGGSGNVTFEFCGETGIPLWVAYQDGSGPWTRVVGNAQNEYRFQIDANRGGVAWVTLEDGFPQTTVFYYTRTEFLAISGTQCGEGGGGFKTVNGSVAGLGPLESAFISLGGASTQVSVGQPPSFVLNNVVDGLQDLVAARAALSISGSGANLTTNRIVIRRGLNPANNATLPVINFATEGFAPASASLTVNGVTATEIAASVGFFTTQRGGLGGYFFGIETGTQQTYYGIPTNQLAPGDLHYLQVAASDTTGVQSGAPGSTRQVGTAFRDVQNRTVTLGPALVVPTISTVATAPYARLRAQWTLQPQYNRFLYAVFTQALGASTTGRGITLGTTSSYLGGSTSADLVVPDFSGVSGWDNSWGLVAGASTVWTVSGSGWNGPGVINFPELADGTQFFSGTRSGRVTP